jgi:hypothetical protein
MKNFTKCFIVLMALLVVGSAASAASLADHVKIAPNQKGDLLFYPFYIAVDGGFDNKIVLINTDLERCVVAKIVFRSWVNSEEVLDFLIYLSPADVWTGFVRFTANGPVVFSTDGSALAAANVWGSTETPLNQPLFPVSCPNDSNQIGYITVFESTSFIASQWTSIVELKAGERATRPVTKSYIKRIYDSATMQGLIPQQPVMEPDVDTRNVLAGYLEFGIPTGNLNSIVRTTTLRDYNNLGVLGIGAETFLGEAAGNNLGEVEAAMAKNNLAAFYYNGETDFSFHFFTFPTKDAFRFLDLDDCVCSTNLQGGIFWDGICSLVFSPQVFDLEENTVIQEDIFSGGTQLILRWPNEVNILTSLGFPFAEGWTRYAINIPTPGYTAFTNPALEEVIFGGAPVIGTLLHFKDLAFAMERPAHDDGSVSVNGEEMPDYQYADRPYPGHPVVE